LTTEPAPRVSPWWMAAPALLFIANFVAAALTQTSASKNAVYSASAIIGTIAVDLVLIGYVLFAVRMSRRPMYVDPRRAVSELGLPQSGIEEALARAVAWFRAQGYARP